MSARDVLPWIDFLLERFAAAGERPALVWKDQSFSYQWLTDAVTTWAERLRNEVHEGTVVALEADFSPNSVALFLALAGMGCTLVPLAPAVGAKRDEFLEIAQVELSLIVERDDTLKLEKHATNRAEHPLYQQLRSLRHPGLILFSSGSTGKNKAALHDLVPLLAKFKVPRHSWRTASFLLFDHIGGVNTALYTLSNAGCLIVLEERTPDAVLAAIERHNVELLPTSPTFLNLVLLSGAYQRHDLSSLRSVTYGTEPMPDSTLRRFHELFPTIKLQQTYGLSEVGILRSQSRGSDSLWVRVGGEGFETRIVDGMLQIKAESAMLGYLNAPSPLTEDGWFITGDAVETDGDYIRILGRSSEIINVGGEKVYPAEVESVLQEHPEVAEVTVYGERNAITGQMVCARVTPISPTAMEAPALMAELKRYARAHLKPFQVPVRIVVSAEAQHGARFKRLRQPGT